MGAQATQRRIRKIKQDGQSRNVVQPRRRPAVAAVGVQGDTSKPTSTRGTCSRPRSGKRSETKRSLISISTSELKSQGLGRSPRKPIPRKRDNQGRAKQKVLHLKKGIEVLTTRSLTSVSNLEKGGIRGRPRRRPSPVWAQIDNQG